MVVFRNAPESAVTFVREFDPVADEDSDTDPDADTDSRSDSDAWTETDDDSEVTVSETSEDDAGYGDAIYEGVMYVGDPNNEIEDPSFSSGTEDTSTDDFEVSSDEELDYDPRSYERDFKLNPAVSDDAGSTPAQDSPSAAAFEGAGSSSAQEGSSSATAVADDPGLCIYCKQPVDDAGVAVDHVDNSGWCGYRMHQSCFDTLAAMPAPPPGFRCGCKKGFGP